MRIWIAYIRSNCLDGQATSSSLSHSSAESEIVSLGAVLRMEAYQTLQWWICELDTFSHSGAGDNLSAKVANVILWHSVDQLSIDMVDQVPSTIPDSSFPALLFIAEDNEAVIRMIIQGRSPHLRHVCRTDRLGLDWLFDRINLDNSTSLEYVRTAEPLAGNVDQRCNHNHSVGVRDAIV